jgi:hypothetical protein
MMDLPLRCLLPLVPQQTLEASLPAYWGILISIPCCRDSDEETCVACVALEFLASKLAYCRDLVVMLRIWLRML